MAETLSGPRGEVAPLTVLIGDLLIRGLEYLEHVDFLLSVRDEKLATLLQVFRDYGWWVVAIGAAIWLLYEFRRRKADENARGSFGSLVASVAFVSFLLGSLITVRATGSLPNVIENYGGDVSNQKCTADIDTTRLSGFSEDYKLVLLCGMMDAGTDPLDDTRIAVSNTFHISSSRIRGITTPIGKLSEVCKPEFVSANPMPPLSQGQTLACSFQMWHAVALIPKDVESTSIKKASDIKQLGGRILTDPVGGWGSPMAIPLKQPMQSGVPKQESSKRKRGT
jgi:hypothetical protein